MKQIIAPLLCLLSLAPALSRADTPLTITSSSPYGCLQNAFINPTPPQITGNFTLNGVTGTGTIKSSVPASAPTFSYPPQAYFFDYSIDLSTMSPAPNHCVKLVIHFGTPQGCGFQEVFGDPSAIQSATLAPFGDITFVFTGSCLSPSQPSVSFLMFSEAAPKTGTVTVIDDYTDPASGQNIEVKYNVAALVPDIPPNPPPWLLAPAPLPNVFFQGLINNYCNAVPMLTNKYATVPYDFKLQLLSAPTNGLAVSQITTQTVQVVNGMFNIPLPFDPITMGDGSVRFLSVSVRTSGVPAVDFTPITPALPLTPSPQALYAYSAGVVADLSPGQAVTSLNGLTDAVNLQGGAGIVLGTNGNTLTINAQPGIVSDRNLKADFSSIAPDDILQRLAQLPISSWRYVSENKDVRHVGPMAQDFKAAFGLGNDEKLINFADAEGVALAAIKGLNQKLQFQASDLKTKEEEIRELKRLNLTLEKRLEILEQKVETNPKPAASSRNDL